MSSEQPAAEKTPLEVLGGFDEAKQSIEQFRRQLVSTMSVRDLRRMTAAHAVFDLALFGATVLEEMQEGQDG